MFKREKEFLFLVSLLLIPFICIGQGEVNKLLEQLKNETSLEQEGELNLQISNELVYDDADKAFEYAQEGLEIAEKLENKSLEAKAYSSLAFIKYSRSLYKEALPFFKKEFQLYEILNDTSEMIQALSYQSNALSYLGNNDEAIPLVQNALKMANQLDDKNQISIILNRMGMIYYRMSDYTTAMKYLNQAYDIDIAYQTYNVETTLNAIAIVNSMNGQYNKAMAYFRKLLNETKGGEDQHEYGIALENLGGVHKTMGTYDSALIYFLEYLEIKKDYENEFDLAWAYSQIAEIQMELGSLNEAFKNSYRAVKLFEKVGVLVYLTDGLINYAKIQIKRGQLTEARKSMTRAVKIANEQGNKKHIGTLFNLSGLLSTAEGNSELALSHHQDALVIFEEVGIKSEYAHTLYYIANAQLRLEQYEGALENAKKSLNIVETINYNSFLDELYELLTKCAAETGDFENAFNYLSAWKALEDSVLNVVKTERLAELQTELYVSEKVAENEQLKLEQADYQVTIQRRTIIGIALGLLMLFLGGVAYWLLQTNKRRKQYNQELEAEVARQTQQLQKANEELQYSNQELERFAYIASHDLKEPLRNISSFTALLRRKIEHLLTNETKIYFDFIVNGTKQMNALVVDVLEFSRLSEGGITKTEVNIDEVIENIKKTLEKTLHEKNVVIHSQPLPVIQADALKIYSVFKNLIENGIKYNKNPNPSIHINYEDLENDVQFKIKDNGIGISEDYQNTIFEMFKRLHNREEFEGTGIGLAFVKKVIHQHGGKIWVESKEGEGSTFLFTIPK